MSIKLILLPLIFIFFISTKSQTCNSGMYITNNQCFNQLKLFNYENKYYRAGHFATNSKGDMIIEYSYNEFRLFYGLTKDGKEYYPGGIKEIELTSENIDPEEIRRYESLNLFVSLASDVDKEKEYLMSISSWKTVVELFDIENNDYNLLSTEVFFERDEGTFSYIFQLLEAKYQDSIIYFCIFTYVLKDSNDVYISGVTGIKRFGLSDTNFNYVFPNKILIQDCRVTRITSSIIFEIYNAIAIFYWPANSKQYILRLYNYDLGILLEDVPVSDEIDTSSYGNGYFFKACYLHNEYASFIYYVPINHFIFKIIRLDSTGNHYSVGGVISFAIDQEIISPDIRLSDFVKLDNDRLALISAFSYTTLNILLFDLYDWYKGLKVRFYRYEANNEIISYFGREISAHIYNGFLAFTATVLPPESNYDSNNFFSMFLLFGYANGTDSEIDLYPYFYDSENYDASNNLYNYLINSLTIDNNIFGYVPAEQIKLVSIPEEIIFLYNNDTQISNNEVFSANHKLEQTPDKIKNDDYYFLDYQYIVREPDFNIFYSTQFAYMIREEGDLSNIEQLFTPKTFYGRVNRLKFKLCNNNCKTCKVIGNSIIDQKCESCPDNYTIDSPEHSSNCKPNGYFIDYDTGTLVQCTPENSKFYTDANNNNAIVCMKNTEECPNDYPYYDSATKECKSQPQNIPSTLIAQNPTTNQIRPPPTTIPIPQTTIPIPQTTIPIPPTTIPIPPTTYVSPLTDEITKKDENVTQMNHSIFIIQMPMINMTNEEIVEKIDNEILADYQVGTPSIEIKGENNSVFLITTADNELNMFSNYNLMKGYGLSIIDLGDCEKSLRDHYDIDPSLPLIIKKYEQLTISAERNIQYEVYNPITKEKLNLELCNDDTVDIYIPVQLDEKLSQLYEDLKSSGYDLFNINDPFYNDLCSPYKSENGTDVLLSDRKNDYYNNDYTTCQSNCQYSSFNSEYKFLKCECKVIVDDIDVNNFNKLSKKIYKNFFDILKNSNYKTLKCYNLVFNAEKLKSNIGSFVVIFFFAGFTSFFAIYIIKGIAPLQNEIIKTVSNKFKDVDIKKIEQNLNDKNNKNNKNNELDTNLKKEKKDKKEKKEKKDKHKSKRKSKKSIKNVKFPPKKRKSVAFKEEQPEIVEEKKKKRKSKKYKDNNINNNTTSDNAKRKSKNVNKISLVDDKKVLVTETQKDLIEKPEKVDNKKKRKSKEILYNLDQYISEKKLDDLDLNNLTYEKAIELDKRQLSEIYWSKLKRKHLLIFTFFSCDDHNLVYIKIARFIFIICTSLAMNVIFFFDSSMHKIYLDYGKYNFIQQIPQIIYSSLVSAVIETLIGILSYTDSNIYAIRQIEEYNPEKIKKIMRTIKIKLIIFFIVTFIFFAFYWYLISSFCAVYSNTQIIYLKDVATSFCLGLIYPFAIQLAFALLRICTLRDKKKSRSFLYKFC